ncbi:hypothetical protein DFH09DRAFT_1298162 [Mycena vulgaris]|nr:hypothetical protein DFH09DRAFT_1298162 [Mycena vulgaris]
MPTYYVCREDETWARLERAVIDHEKNRMDLALPSSRLPSVSGPAPFHMNHDAESSFLLKIYVAPMNSGSSYLMHGFSPMDMHQLVLKGSLHSSSELRDNRYSNSANTKSEKRACLSAMAAKTGWRVTYEVPSMRDEVEEG